MERSWPSKHCRAFFQATSTPALRSQPHCYAALHRTVGVNGVSMGLNDFIRLPDGITVEVRMRLSPLAVCSRQHLYMFAAY